MKEKMNKLKKMFEGRSKIEKTFMIIAPLILILGVGELINTEIVENEKASIEIEQKQVEEVNKKEESIVVIERENIVGTSDKELFKDKYFKAYSC